jgi:hypothetical protein
MSEDDGEHSQEESDRFAAETLEYASQEATTDVGPEDEGPVCVKYVQPPTWLAAAPGAIGSRQSAAVSTPSNPQSKGSHAAPQSIIELVDHLMWSKRREIRPARR